jgi:hypothetical protein
MLRFRGTDTKVPIGAFISPTAAYANRRTALASFSRVFRLFGDPGALVKLDNIVHDGVPLGEI